MQPSCEQSSTVKFTFFKACECAPASACVLEPNSFSALSFSLKDQLFHPWVQSTALADGSGRADTYYHLMEGRGGGEEQEIRGEYRDTAELKER